MWCEKNSKVNISSSLIKNIKNDLLNHHPAWSFVRHERPTASIRERLHFHCQRRRVPDDPPRRRSAIAESLKVGLLRSDSCQLRDQHRDFYGVLVLLHVYILSEAASWAQKEFSGCSRRIWNVALFSLTASKVKLSLAFLMSRK